MSRELDVILFGASGFTGKHMIPYLHKFSKTNNRHLTWGIAGRSKTKLINVLAECKDQSGTSLDDIPLIVANLDDQTSLNRMASRARIIINCCGPYSFYGEPVVKACIEEGTHHVDVSAEPQFLEKMQLKYQNAASEKGVYIIGSCGFDCIPSDLGVVFLQQKCGGTLNSVTAYFRLWEEDCGFLSSAVNFGTWASAIYVLAQYNELKHIRSKLFCKPLPIFEPAMPRQKLLHKTNVEGWCARFYGTDCSVIRRSQRLFYENESQRPVQIQTYHALEWFLLVVVLFLGSLNFAILSRFRLGRKLLLNFPKIFSLGMISKEPPSKKRFENSKFELTLYGEGWKNKLSESDEQSNIPVDKKIAARVKGANVGYGVTCICAVLAAITVITETDRMPIKGGVYPPGFAFAKTSLIEKLNQNEVTFEVLFEKNLRE